MAHEFNSSQYRPFMAEELRADFVGRPREYGALKRALLDASGTFVGITGVVGGGGFGKTTLARALCHDAEIRDWFHDGILWLRLGEKSNEDSLLAGARDLIKLITGNDATETTRDGIRAALRDALLDRFVLLVLDDVWKGADRAFFDNLGKNVRVLVTTRKPYILLPEAHSTVVSTMRHLEARTLLTYRLPHGHLTDLDKLAKRLGYWALLLKLANGQLQHLIKRGVKLASAITRISQSLDIQGYDALDNLESDDARNQAASISLNVSVSLLNEIERERFNLLAIFPEDTAIPVSILTHLWDCKEFDADKSCDNLFKLSLVSNYYIVHKEVYLHDVVRTYLRDIHRESLTEWNRRFLSTFDVKNWYEIPKTEIHLWRNLAFHLTESGQADTLRHLLTNFEWLQAKLDATDAAALLADFTAIRGDETIRLVHSAVRLSIGALTDEKRQLAPQLAGRLFSYYEEPGISELIGNAIYPAGMFKSISQHFPSHIQAGSMPIRKLEGHKSSVSGALVLSNSHLLSWSRDKTLRLWHTDGSSIAVLEGHKLWVNGARILPDDRIVSWSNDTTLRIWTTDGTLLRVLNGHRSEVLGVLELANGRLLSWSTDKTLRLWAVDGTPLRVLKGHTDWVYGALVLANGCLLSWSRDTTLRIWTSDGTPLRSLEGHSGAVFGAQVLTDSRLLSWSWDGTLRIWESDGRALHILRGHASEIGGAIDLQDGRLLSWSNDMTLRLWAENGTSLIERQSHTDSIKGLVALGDGRLLSWSDDATLRLWAEDSTPSQVLNGHTAAIEGALALTNGNLLSWQGNKYLPSLRLRNLHKAGIKGTLALTNGDLLSWQDDYFWDDHALKLWNADGTPLRNLIGHMGSIKGALALEGSYMLSWSGATDSKTGTLQLWTEDGTLLRNLEGHQADVTGALALGDGRLLSWSGPAFSNDHTLRLWDNSGNPIGILAGHVGAVTGALALSDGRLLSWSNDTTLRLWLGNGAVLNVLRGHKSEVSGALELADGQLLSWSSDRSLRLWASDGTPLCILKSHTGPVSGAISLPDGRVLSWSDDRSLRLWKMNGSLQYLLEGHTEEINGALALHDGRILSWSNDKTLRLWDLTGKGLLAFYGDAPLMYCAVLSELPLQITIGDSAGRVIFLRLVE